MTPTSAAGLKDEDKQAALKGLEMMTLLAISKSFEIVDKASTSLTLGVGATAALIIGNAGALTNVFATAELKLLLALLVVAGIAGISAKYYAVKIAFVRDVYTRIFEEWKPLVIDGILGGITEGMEGGKSIVDVTNESITELGLPAVEKREIDDFDLGAKFNPLYRNQIVATSIQIFMFIVFLITAVFLF